MSKSYDVVVIGAGPAGYIAAIRAAQHGLNVACIDEWKNKDGKNAFGGTCLNAGCIPSKALLESSELYHRAQHEFSKHGISTGELGMDVAAMQKRRASIVRQLTGGIAGLFKANKIDGLVGHGKLLAGKRVEFTSVEGDVEIIEAENVVLGSGSTPIEFGIAAFDDDNIVDSWGALEFDAVPDTLGVIGAGVVGLELGSVWARLGAKVTIIEAMDDFLFMADRDVANVAAKEFKKQGLDIKLGSKMTAATVDGDSVKVDYEDAAGSQSINVDKLVQKEDGWDALVAGDYIGSKKYRLEEDTELYMSRLARKAKKMKYHMITNPCGEIALTVLGGYCTIADVVPYHAETLDEAEEAFRAAVRALIRVNTMDCLYATEVRRTNRIGVGMTGVMEFAWKFFRYGFRDLIDEEKSKDFWLTLARFNQAIYDEAVSYSDMGVQSREGFPRTCRM